MIRQDVVWMALAWPGIEHLRMAVTEAGVEAGGLIVAMVRERALRLDYELRCDEHWRCRWLRVASLLDPGSSVELHGDGGGRWTNATGEPLPALDGCLDVDIAATPFTNTLPIRRLGLESGAAAEISVVYVEVPGLAVRAAPQRYTCLECGAAGGRWRYENVASGYSTELVVDGDALVVDYPDVWRRVWMSAAELRP